jgi:hypothetical protein
MRRALTLSAVLATAVPLHAACTAASAGTHVVDHYITDNVLHRKWAVMVDCSHPERPWTMEEVPVQRMLVAAPGSAPQATPLPSIAAGAEVLLWRADADAKIQLRGVALDSAKQGEMIHVRLLHSTVVLEGKVCGPGSAELVTLDRWKSQ